jgi:hypothetical protein
MTDDERQEETIDGCRRETMFVTRGARLEDVKIQGLTPPVGMRLHESRGLNI